LKAFGIAALILLAAGAHAQGVAEVPVDGVHLAGWLARGAAIEVAIPPDATVLALDFGDGTTPMGWSTFLREPFGNDVNLLRVVVVPPEEPGGSGVCGANTGLAMVFASQVTGMDDEPLAHTPFCVPYPATPDLTDGIYQVIREQPVALGAWTPVYLHAWLLDVGAGELALPVDQAFAVQVAFLTGNSTTFPDEPPPSLSEILDLSSVQDLVAPYRLVGTP